MSANSQKDMMFFSSRTAWFTALLVIVGLGFAIRLYDLTDPPLDFHPTRQLLSALKARGMYYQTLADVPPEQRTFALQQWKLRAAIEPEVMERLVAYTYRFSGEQIWIARIYSSVFWMIGAVFLFLIAREFASVDGALAAMAVYLFLPYGVIASRSFQPDPLMVMLIIIFWWAMIQWSNDMTSYQFAVIAGLFGGLAIFVKFVAVFFIVGGALGAILRESSVRELVRRPQLHVMIILGALPGSVYMIYGVWVAGYLGQQFGGRFIPSLFLSPSYYLGWLGVLNLVIGSGMLLISLLGLFFLRREKPGFVLALWISYALFGLCFNYHIASHDYYSLPLVPIVALSFAPLAASIFSQLAASVSMKTAIIMVLSLGISASLWGTRAEMKSADYRSEPAMWEDVSEKVGDHKLVGLTADYGSSLAYWGWKNLTPWPTSGDLNYHVGMRGAQGDFEKQFEELARNRDLFIVTSFDDLDQQPLLRNRLMQQEIFAQGDGYIIYDISQ
jgi:hypothetical protein